MPSFVSELTVGWLSFTRVPMPFGSDLWHCSSDGISYTASAMLREIDILIFRDCKVFAR